VAARLDLDRVGYSNVDVNFKSCQKINPKQMKTKMRDTSLEAYKKLGLSRQQKLVLGALRMLKGKGTNRQVAKYLRMDCSTVAGRMNWLFNNGIVKEGKKVKDPVTNVTVQQWVFTARQLKLL
jgi:hypothetical protein